MVSCTCIDQPLLHAIRKRKLQSMATVRGQFGALSNDRTLRDFVVQAIPTGRQLGTGSYGTVQEVCTETESKCHAHNYDLSA